MRELSLSVPRGSVFGFLGQNGAGKTTAIKILAGITRPDAGSVTIGGRSVADPAVRAHIGFMPEAPYFYERLSGLEFLRFSGALFGMSGRDGRYGKVLQDVGLFAARDRAIATYSKGMKQRLAFASALVNEPSHLLLDEPLDGLDPLGRAEVKRFIAERAARGATVFFNSHILYDIEELCDAIGILHDSELRYAGPVAEFCGGKPLEQRFVDFLTELRRGAAVQPLT